MKPAYRPLIFVLLALGSAAAAPAYHGVNLNIQQELGNLTLSSAETASPVLGVKNFALRQGVAYVNVGSQQSDLSLNVSPKYPLWLSLKMQQGDATLNLSRVPLRSLNIKQELGNLNLSLPAANLNINLRQSQGDTVITLPPNTGLQVVIQNFEQGKLTIQGKQVASGLSATGTFATSTYETATYKVNLTINNELGDLTIR